MAAARILARRRMGACETTPPTSTPRCSRQARPTGPVSRGPAYADGRLFFVQADNTVVALDELLTAGAPVTRHTPGATRYTS